MDQRQKSALRMNHITLADQLILDEDFFAQLRTIKIFSDGMINIIKAETKPRDQVYKMMELLEKRGPNAFDNFITILRENFWWVASKLEETYQEKMEASRRNDRRDYYPSQQPQPQPVTRRPRPVQRAVSTPLQSRPQKSGPYPIQVSTSTSSFQESASEEKHNPKSFRMDNRIQQIEDTNSGDELDGPFCTNNKAPSGETDGESTTETTRKPTEDHSYPEKNYVDKSLSPIHILESSTKKVSNAVCSPIPVLDDERKDFKDSKDEQEGEKVENGDEIKDDAVDESENVTNTVEMPDGEFESSEVYYDRVRTESVFEDADNSFYSQQLDDDEDETIAADGGEDEMYRAYSSQSSLESDLIEREDEDGSAIREIYLKLQWLTDEETRLIEGGGVYQSNVRNVEETGITFPMIIEKLDDLIDKHTNSDFQKLITSCYKFFDDKDKKLPLYTCIEKLRDAKNELNSRLLDEMRKTNEMANDMYRHSQDMKNLEKLKSKMAKQELENIDLKEKCEGLEKTKTEQARRISELEGMILTFSETRKEDKKVQRRAGISPKRSQMSQGLTPRNKPLYTDPRMAIMQTGYQSSKSPRTQTGTSAWRPYKK